LRRGRGSAANNEDDDEDDDLIMRAMGRFDDEDALQSSDDDEGQSLSARERRNARAQGIELDISLPQEWKEIEDEESDIAFQIWEHLGPLAVLLYRRIVSLKILSDFNSGTAKDPLKFL
jgi:hypothetical protein